MATAQEHRNRPGGPRQPLNIGPMYVEDAVDPDDVDARGDIAAAAALGSAPDILLLMELNTAAYEDLRPKLALKRDEDRTAFLVDTEASEDDDDAPDFVSLINDALSPPDGRVIHASVRGAGRQRIFSLIVEHESGRTRKDYIPYGDVPEFEEAYKTWKAEKDGKPGAGVTVAGDAETQRLLASLLEEVSGLRQRTEDAEERAAAAEERAADPEPWPGFDGLTVDEVRNALAGAESYGVREGMKARVRDYEPRHENRSGVLKLAAPEDPPAPPPES